MPKRDAETTLYALKRILNLPDTQQIEFADKQDFFSTPSLDLSDPLSTALKQRPELHSLSESVKAAELAHKAAVAESLPKLAFEGTWNEQGQTFSARKSWISISLWRGVPNLHRWTAQR